MILIGIISVQKKNNLLSYVKSKKINICDAFGDDIRFVPIEIILYRNIKRKTLYKRIERAKILLNKKGVSQVLLTNELRDILGDKKCKGIPAVNLIESFEHLYKKVGKGQYNSIYLYDEKLSFLDYHNLSKIIYLAKSLVIYTAETERAKSLARDIFYEYGVWIDVREGVHKDRNVQMVIDADNGKVRIGDITVDDIEYDVDCSKYNLDFRYLADDTCLSNCLKIKNLMAGKNLIKLVDK